MRMRSPPEKLTTGTEYPAFDYENQLQSYVASGFVGSEGIPTWVSSS